MKWEKRHDIIINWIDSCKTFDQLMNLIPVVKAQTFTPEVKIKMLDFISLKAKLVTITIYNDELQKLKRFLC